MKRPPKQPDALAAIVAFTRGDADALAKLAEDGVSLPNESAALLGQIVFAAGPDAIRAVAKIIRKVGKRSAGAPHKRHYPIAPAEKARLVARYDAELLRQQRLAKDRPHERGESPADAACRALAKRRGVFFGLSHATIINAVAEARKLDPVAAEARKIIDEHQKQSR